MVSGISIVCPYRFAGYILRRTTIPDYPTAGNFTSSVSCTRYLVDDPDLHPADMEEQTLFSDLVLEAGLLLAMGQSFYGLSVVERRVLKINMFGECEGYRSALCIHQHHMISFISSSLYLISSFQIVTDMS